MRNRAWPEELDLYSTLIGENILLVQGPGGNTSYKNNESLWVKASGTRLSEANTREIFAEVDIETGEAKKSGDQLRPSIEKDFHLLIPYSFVIHTHSLRAISLAIENDFGSKSSMYPEIAFVPYARPGKDLCEKLKAILDYKIHKGAILQNHGFLTWGDSMEEAYTFLKSFEEHDSDTQTDISEIGSDFTYLEHPKAITPDYAVFLSPVPKEEILGLDGNNLWKKQMYSVSQKAASMVEARLGVNYLESSEVAAIQNWESEKYRLASNK